MSILDKIGYLQSHLLLGVFYFIILAPVALIFKCLADPLGLHQSIHAGWRKKQPPHDRWRQAKAQW